MDNHVPETTIAGVTLINTPIVQAAQKYARAHLNDVGFNHVMRSWILGVVVYKKLREAGAISEIDLEVQAVSAILHDLGWDITGELISKDKRFEVDGAEAACNWIKEEQRNGKTENWDDFRLRLVWDAIALHTTPSISLYKEQVVKVCTLGIDADFRGLAFDENGTISEEVYDAVNKRFPRLDLAKGLRDVICGFCRTKPQTTYDTFQMEYGKRFVEGYTTEGHLLFDAAQATSK
ncbi:hypothetical protein J3F84DRAFT_406383 [Trichoderma pleuroticola]|uniref:HD domain-containing protein n=1 Tax=Trichoderma harzianum TaxID=5544 RepID=A0A2K0U338_TRIHA|nr:hypothetical protein THARTR1_07398 [Trichoderma harzianum]